MNTMAINLARKWRSKNFEQIVGQDLSVRMLKNSLYLGNYFPVYLFSGQRGCGKTSLARVFACAINCSSLPLFQKKPAENIIPCLTCQSCLAMSTGSHPDFVEIDAASHTGVDMIRQVIDASSLLPVMGVKKVYLIDEAHMLSKASFNALLKVLEEPSPSVLFMLATTDSQKIIDTVRSRCFQLFFKSIDGAVLVDHLQKICEQEQIPSEREGLRLIVEESEGSARDAINMLEQVRFSSSIINKAAVLAALGHVSDERVVELLGIILCKNPSVLLRFLQDHEIERSSIEFLYRRFTDLVRAAIWMKYNVAPQVFKNQQKEIAQSIASCAVARLNDMLELLCRNEQIFQKTTAKYPLFEMIMLQLCQKNNRMDNSSGSAPCLASSVAVEPETESFDQTETVGQDESVDTNEAHDASWRLFATRIATVGDPILMSVFTQGFFIARDKNVVQVAFGKELLFFKDWLDKTIGLWQPLLNESFHDVVLLEPLFTLEKKGRTEKIQSNVGERTIVPERVKMIKPEPILKPVAYQQPARVMKPFKTKVPSWPAEAIWDVSDQQMWQKTNMILRHFPGIVTENKQIGTRGAV